MHGIFDDTANGDAGRELRDLSNAGQAGAFAKGDFASVGSDVGGENLQECGFARTVRPDQADAIAVGNIEGDILKERMEAISLRQRMSTDDGWQAARILLFVLSRTRITAVGQRPAGLGTAGVEKLALGEEFFEGGGTVVEDAAEVGSDEKAVDEPAAGDGVFDFVADQGAAVTLFERVFVMPVAVRAAELIVREGVRRVPAGDFALPADGNAVKFELVLNARAAGNDDGPRREDAEVQEGRSELFEMFGSGEEWEDF